MAELTELFKNACEQIDPDSYRVISCTSFGFDLNIGMTGSKNKKYSYTIFQYNHNDITHSAYGEKVEDALEELITDVYDIMNSDNDDEELDDEFSEAFNMNSNEKTEESREDVIEWLTAELTPR